MINVNGNPSSVKPKEFRGQIVNLGASQGECIHLFLSIPLPSSHGYMDNRSTPPFPILTIYSHKIDTFL